MFCHVLKSLQVLLSSSNCGDFIKLFLIPQRSQVIGHGNTFIQSKGRLLAPRFVRATREGTSQTPTCFYFILQYKKNLQRESEKHLETGKQNDYTPTWQAKGLVYNTEVLHSAACVKKKGPPRSPTSQGG